uniref:Uncharacterized protein n=1 Tax=Ignisphaera aggregans TaxID=334771 RepID=A0A7J2U5I1_9CREN
MKRFGEIVGFSVVPIPFGVNRYVNARAVDSIYTVLKELGAVNRLDIMLFCSGGDIDEAYLLATYLQRLAREKLVIYVSRFAKSAGTLLALAGDELVMLPIAGPNRPSYLRFEDRALHTAAINSRNSQHIEQQSFKRCC